MERSNRDQQYIDRLKEKIAFYERREASHLRYIRKLRQHCIRSGVGYPLDDVMAEAVRGCLDKMGGRN